MLFRSPHEDPDLRAEADAALAGEPLVAGYALLPGEGESDLAVQVTLAPGVGPGDVRAGEAIQRAVERIVAGGGGRVRRGITVAVSASDRPVDGPSAGGPAPAEGGSAGGRRKAAEGGTPGAGAGAP